MATIIRVCCDQCGGINPWPVTGTVAQARHDAQKDGWQWIVSSEHGELDRCPACSGINPEYWSAEPF